MLAVEKSGYEIVMHIHDEIVVDGPDEEIAEAERAISGIMSRPPAWAAGLPLRGDGYHTKFYKKD